MLPYLCLETFMQRPIIMAASRKFCALVFWFCGGFGDLVPLIQEFRLLQAIKVLQVVGTERSMKDIRKVCVYIWICSPTIHMYMYASRRIFARWVETGFSLDQICYALIC